MRWHLKSVQCSSVVGDAGNGAPVSLERKAIIHGLLLAMAAPLTILLWPGRIDDVFTCFGDRVAHVASLLFGSGTVAHSWPAYQSGDLCVWLLGAAVTVLAGLGLLNVWLCALTGATFHVHRRWPELVPVRTNRRTVRPVTTTARPVVVPYRKPWHEERRAA